MKVAFDYGSGILWVFHYYPTQGFFNQRDEWEELPSQTLAALLRWS